MLTLGNVNYIKQGLSLCCNENNGAAEKVY